jgi:cell division septation protein DedD
VAELERGRYYIQLGAYSQTQAVEQALAKIDRGYPLAVQCTSSAGRPVYRILVGPVNQGEGGALIRSFKSKGYGDAFIRKGE